MAQARKTRTLRQDVDEYEITLTELLTAAAIPEADIVEGDVWRVRVTGNRVTLVRHSAPQVNPAANRLTR
jgi:hypothetical protein